MIKLGIARKYAKDLDNYIQKIAAQNIDAFEIGFAFGVPRPFPQDFLKTSKKYNVELSGHLPFWINLGNLEKTTKNIEYLIQGIKVAEELQSTVVFHLGFYGKNNYEIIKKNILFCFKEVLNSIQLKNGKIGIETIGKQKAIGNIDEVIDIFNSLNNPNIVPIIDWSHIFAYSNGTILRSYDGFCEILSKFERKCINKPNYFHGGSVIYENGNEKKHISAKNLSPSMTILISALRDNGYTDYTLIIESPDSINDVNWLKEDFIDKL